MQFYTTIVATTLLLLAPLSVLAADFGSCEDPQKCGYMCCRGDELCLLTTCVPADYLEKSLQRQRIAAGTASSLLEQFKKDPLKVFTERNDLFDEVPPATLNTAIPSGFTIPSILPVPTIVEPCPTASGIMPSGTGSACEVTNSTAVPSATAMPTIIPSSDAGSLHTGLGALCGFFAAVVAGVALFL